MVETREGPQGQHLATTGHELPEPVPPHAPSEHPAVPRRFLVPAVAIAIAIAVAAAGGVWWLLDSTVSQSDYDDLAAELDVTDRRLADAETQLADAETQLADAETQLADARGALTDAETQLMEFVTLSLTEGAGLEEADARCVATGIVDDLGVEALILFIETARTASADVPPPLFRSMMNAAIDCGVPMDDLG